MAEITEGDISPACCQPSACEVLSVFSESCFCVAEGTDNLSNAFEGSTYGIGDCVMALYSTMYSYSGW